MGRARIELKKIENTSSRLVTFTKRRGGLFKKANELAILCDAEVAIVIFSSTGKLYQFSSSSMERILSRFHTCIESANNPSTKHKRQKQEPLEQVAVLKEEVEKLKKKQRQLLGKDITGMRVEELRELEQQLNEGLLCIKDRKEQILVEHLEESKIQEQRVVLDNETLRKQVEQLQGFCPPSHYPASHYIDSQPTINRNHAIKQGSASPRMACNTGLGDAGSDINLQLGPPTSGEHQERKMSDGETHSRNTKRQVGSW